MLNYISAEWYKLRHTKGIFLALGLLLALIAMMFLPAFWYPEPSFRVYTAAYIAFLPVGFFLAPVFAARAFDDQYGRGTMKNEIVFGISRSRIYLGKLAFGALVGIVSATVILCFYLLMSVLSGGLGEENTAIYLDMSIQATLLVLPLWLASLSLAFCLQVIVKSSAGAIALDYLLLFFGVPIALVGVDEPTASFVLNFFTRWFFAAPFRVAVMSLNQGCSVLSDMGYSWMVGLGWVLATSLLALAAFSRKEIN